MAAESIGALYSTKIPGYADAADIQAALRAYHYGSYTFDTSETNPANLINPSIAYTINNKYFCSHFKTKNYKIYESLRNCFHLESRFI